MSNNVSSSYYLVNFRQNSQVGGASILTQSKIVKGKVLSDYSIMFTDINLIKLLGHDHKMCVCSSYADSSIDKNVMREIDIHLVKH